MAHIFISYSGTDIEIARQIKNRLEDGGFAVWMDETGIPVGGRWWQEIVRAVDASAALVVIVSPEATESEYVELEILHAKKTKKLIVPILIRGEEWSWLANIQYTDMRLGVPSELPETLIQDLQAAGATQQPEKPQRFTTIFGWRIPRWVDYLVIASLVLAFVVILLSLPNDQDQLITDFGGCVRAETMGAGYEAPNRLIDEYVADAGDDTGCAAKLSYSVTDWVYFWVRLDDHDLDRYTILVFDLRADEPVPDRIRIELIPTGQSDDQGGDPAWYTFVSRISDEWREVTLTRDDFRSTADPQTRLSSFAGMYEVRFVLWGEDIAGEGAKEGAFYLDNIEFRQ